MVNLRLEAPPSPMKCGKEYGISSNHMIPRIYAGIVANNAGKFFTLTEMSLLPVSCPETKPRYIRCRFDMHADHSMLSTFQRPLRPRAVPLPRYV